MKRIIAVILIIIMLCGCSQKNDNMRDSFSKYYKEMTHQEKEMLYSPNQFTFKVFSLYKENSSDNPHVILSITLLGDESETYRWLQLSPDDKKKELKYCGDIVTGYAKDNNWYNNYYLFVALTEAECNFDYVYDYEEDVIWIPNSEHIFISMYNQFETVDLSHIEELPGGKDFIIDHNLGSWKHNEIEYEIVKSYKVFIHDGEFGSYNSESSTSH